MDSCFVCIMSNIIAHDIVSTYPYGGFSSGNIRKIESIPRKDDEQIEVSYSILYGNKRSYDELFQEVSVAIDLQLILDDKYLPFIDPIDFDNANYQDKLFIYGPSGSGKSRNI